MKIKHLKKNKKIQLTYESCIHVEQPTFTMQAKHSDHSLSVNSYFDCKKHHIVCSCSETFKDMESYVNHLHLKHF